MAKGSDRRLRQPKMWNYNVCISILKNSCLSMSEKGAFFTRFPDRRQDQEGWMAKGTSEWDYGHRFRSEWGIRI